MVLSLSFIITLLFIRKLLLLLLLLLLLFLFLSALYSNDGVEGRLVFLL